MGTWTSDVLIPLKRAQNAAAAAMTAAAADFIIDIDNLTPMQIAGIIANLIS